jgi:hypothetical protein
MPVQYPLAHPPAPARTKRAPGWWRRNWWALPLLLPLLAAAVGHDIIDGYDKWHKLLPTESVTGPSGQWVSFGGGRLRLQSVNEIHDLKDYEGKPFPLPSNVDVWQATIEIDAPDDAALLGCQIALQDSAGDTYGENPEELSGADINDFGCTRPTGAPTTGTYTVVASFVTPATDVSGVRVTVPTELPRYAWLTAPA